MQILIYGCYMKQKYYTEFIKIRNKKCRQSQFGTFCQITPPLINLNPLSNPASYKAKFSVVEGCLTSIFCLNLIQFLCMLILSHQELLAQNGSSQVKCEHNTHTCIVPGRGSPPELYTSVHRGVRNPISTDWSPA